MVTGFDIWGHDVGLRRHWKNRILAFFIDALLTMVPVTAVLWYLESEDILIYGIYISFVLYLASAIVESMTGASTGKWFFGLKVHPVKEGFFAAKVFVRNLSRLFWFALLPLDFALGLATRGDPRQRMLDRAVGTKVVHRAEKQKHEEHLEALASSEKSEEETVPEPVPAPPISEDNCRECNGKMITLADGKLQCEGCGLIQ